MQFIDLELNLVKRLINKLYHGVCELLILPQFVKWPKENTIDEDLIIFSPLSTTSSVV